MMTKACLTSRVNDVAKENEQRVLEWQVIRVDWSWMIELEIVAAVEELTWQWQVWVWDGEIDDCSSWPY